MSDSSRELRAVRRQVRRSQFVAAVAVVVAIVATGLSLQAPAGAQETVGTFVVLSNREECQRYQATVSNPRPCGHLQPGTVRETHIATNAVSSRTINRNAVDFRHIRAAAIRSRNIADNTITSADLSANSVMSWTIFDGAVTTTDIADGAVDSDAIADGAVNGDDVGSLDYDDVDGLAPTFAGATTFVVGQGPQFGRSLGLAPAGTTVDSRSINLTPSAQIGGDWSCTYTKGNGNQQACIEVPTAGRYLVDLVVTWEADAGGQRLATVVNYGNGVVDEINGGTTYGGAGRGWLASSAIPTVNNGVSNEQVQRLTQVVDLAAGDQLIAAIASQSGSQALDAHVSLVLVAL